MESTSIFDEISGVQGSKLVTGVPIVPFGVPDFFFQLELLNHDPSYN